MKALFVQHWAERCGVASCGRRTFHALRWAGCGAWGYRYANCGSLDQLKHAEEMFKPDVVIINWHPAAMPWIPKDFTTPGAPRVAIVHDDLRPEWAKEVLKVYPYFTAALWKCPAPSCGFETKDAPGVYPLLRLVPPGPAGPPPTPAAPPRVALFGFGNADKLIEEAVAAIDASYPDATIACHFPGNDVVDKDGLKGFALLKRVREAAGEAHQVEASDEMMCNAYMSDNALIEWLSESTVNLLMHGEHNSTSSSADLCMAAGVPFATNRSPFFRHLPEAIKLCPGKMLKDVAAQGIAPWERLARHEWAPSAHALFIEEILTEVAR